MSAPVQPVVHTPGPWSLLCDEARGRPRCLVVDKDGGEIAAVNPHRTAWNENADLMAAAPELLDALIYLRRTMYSDTSEESMKADAAIAKALGKVV